MEEYYTPVLQNLRKRKMLDRFHPVIIPHANFVCGGYTVFMLSVRPFVRASVLNILESHCLIFIKPCKHVYICKTNTLDKKVRARGQFY